MGSGALQRLGIPGFRNLKLPNLAGKIRIGQNVQVGELGPGPRPGPGPGPREEPSDLRLWRPTGPSILDLVIQT